MIPVTRLTRKQQQARTRANLLASAAAVFAEKGLTGASVNDIVARAGHTKGAFYAHFSSKEELFLVMLDGHFAKRLAAIKDRTTTGGTIGEQAEQVGADFVAMMKSDEAWSRLFVEFAALAARHEPFRRELVARNDALRASVGVILAQRVEEAGITSPVSFDVLARMTFAMAHGVGIEHLLDDATPDDLFGTMLRIFLAGLVAESTGNP